MLLLIFYFDYKLHFTRISCYLACRTIGRMHVIKKMAYALVRKIQPFSHSNFHSLQSPFHETQLCNIPYVSSTQSSDHY